MKQDAQDNESRKRRLDPDDVIGGFLDTASKIVFFGGLIAVLASVGLLCYYYKLFTGTPPAGAASALTNVELFQKLLIVGSAATVAGAAYMFWGEEVLSALLLLGSGFLWAAPFYLPSMLGGGSSSAGPASPIPGKSIESIQMGGMVMGALALVVLIFDIVMRVRQRAMQGARSDMLKYGKGIKSETDYRNVFMGKCWQLPFCRKFVREACPIYHSRRCCWKEKVGCMCEEEVIRKAMEGRPIPKDMVAAARFIPVNHKITLAQKIERCKSCVIYNEHQKHKYKLWLWITLSFFIGMYVLLRDPLLGAMGNVVANIDSIMGRITFNPNAGISKQVQNNPFPIQEVLLVCLLIVGLAYCLKLVEHLIFKVKI